MVKVIKYELETLSKNDSLQKLLEYSKGLKDTANQLDHFVMFSSLKLKGEGYNAIRTYANSLSQIMEKLSIFDENALENISNSVSNMSAFMESYTILDDSRLNELGNRLRYIGRRIGELNNAIIRGNYSDEDLKYFNRSKYNYEKEYKAIYKEFQKLKELSSKDSSTGSIVSTINRDISSIGSCLR